MVDHTRRDGPCSSRINCHLEGTAEKKNQCYCDKINIPQCGVVIHIYRRCHQTSRINSFVLEQEVIHSA